MLELKFTVGKLYKQFDVDYLERNSFWYLCTKKTKRAANFKKFRVKQPTHLTMRRISKEEFYNLNKSNLLSSMLQKSIVVSKSHLLRSFLKNSSFKSSISRSSSTKKTTTSKSPLSRSSSQKCTNFTRKCSRLAKE
ncbi:hypothetical protein LguiB_025546 [Lonicera macranthoides]